MKELLITSILGVAVLGFDILRLRKFVFPLIVISLLATIAFVVLDWGRNENPMANNMLLMDNFALGFIGAMSVITLFWFLLSKDYFGNDSKMVDLYALVLFALCGAMVLSSFSNLVMLFLGIEILSIPVYVLAASKRGDVLSNESGFKYFFMGAVASAILLFGIALVYGTVGSFDLATISSYTSSLSDTPMMLKAGIMMIIAGFAFKVSVAPFHLWAPDVYQGAPTMITALMATMVKGAAFAAMYRLFANGFASLLDDFGIVLAWLSALTLIMANVVAVIQTNVKRLLAYSSISHAGFMLAAVMTANNTSPAALIFYVVVYSIASLVSFSVLHHVSNIQDGRDDFDAFKGLAKRNPVMAGAMTLSLLSMAGIPPLSGFLAKYFIISNALGAGYIALVIVMILASVVAVYYYLKLIVAMFTPIENAGRIVTSDIVKISLIILSLAMVALFLGAGIFNGIFEM
ncbi:MAG: NADH-quinone oxidoreductase subunit N [Flavobacteriales bacterium]|nr:NADH-quinone oxidoreductase subunit N [Flavobacteriales bacterium]